MEKVLVTGATGFIGNYVINELLSKNVEVIATSASENKAKRFSWFERVKYFPLDLSDLTTEKNYFDYFLRPTKMIHLAWEGLPNYEAKFHLEENLPRHFALLSNLLKNGIKDITVAGTCLEYGLKEGLLKEEDKPEPVIAYAQAKNELRIQLEQIAKNNRFYLKWIRLFYMYGKGQSSKSLLSQLELAIENNEQSFNMSGGEQIRDYLPVKKVAKYIVETTLQNNIIGVINCCSNQPITIKKFVSEYLKNEKKSMPLNYGFYPYTTYEPMKFWGDNSKLKSILHEQ